MKICLKFNIIYLFRPFKNTKVAYIKFTEIAKKFSPVFGFRVHLNEISLIFVLISLNVFRYLNKIVILRYIFR